MTLSQETSRLDYLNDVNWETIYPAAWAERASNGRWKWAKHLAYLNRKLRDVIDGKTKRLLVTIPPRHGKSEFIDEYFAPFYLGKNPDHGVLLASYEATIAKDFGAKAKATFRDNAPQVFNKRLSRTSTASNFWKVEGHRGFMATAGVGGPFTGRGANLLLIDDPIKNSQEAFSLTIRKKIVEWFRSTAYTRLEPGGSAIIIMTRWHQDDLIGVLAREMEEGGEIWEKVDFPAICEAPDLLGRNPGDALWPERYSRKHLLDIKKVQGPYFWNALYQQRPGPQEGTIFMRSWWQEYDVAPKQFDRVIQSWDLAFKDTATSDYVAGQIWGQKGAKFYLLDQVWDKLNFTGSLKAIRAMHIRWPQAREIFIEDTANGPAVINTLKNSISGIIPVGPEGGKVARAHAVSGYMEAGDVYLPAKAIAPWIDDFKDLAANFPFGDCDDPIDAMTQGLLQLSQKKRSRVVSRPRGM